MSDDLKFGYYDCTDNKNLTAPYCQFCGKQHYPTTGGCTQNSFTPPTIPNGCGGDCAPIKRGRELEKELKIYKKALDLMLGAVFEQHINQYGISSEPHWSDTGGGIKKHLLNQAQEELKGECDH